MNKPTKQEALDFAILLSSGVPSRTVIQYFLPEDLQPESVERFHDLWLGSPAISDAIETLRGKKWQEMSVEERIKLSIDKHYSEMAYFLYANNYVDLVGAAKVKADTCRVALEAKLAGSAGKGDAMTQFWDDVVSGKVKINATPKQATIPDATGYSLPEPTSFS